MYLSTCWTLDGIASDKPASVVSRSGADAPRSTVSVSGVGRADVPSGSGRSGIFSACAFVERHRLAHQRFEIRDPAFIAGMRREECRGLPAAIHLRHPLPEIDGHVRISPRCGHEKQADAIRFGFMLAAEGEQHAELPPDSHDAEEFALPLWIHIGHRAGGRSLRNLHHLLLGHPFGAVVGERVADFVSHDRGQRAFSLGDGENAGVDDNFAPRQAEGVDLFTADDVAFPLEVLRFQSRVLHELRIPGCLDQLLGQLFNDLDDRLVMQDLRLRKHLLIRLLPEGRFLLRPHAHDLPPSERSLLAPASHGDANQHQPNQDRQKPEMSSAGRIIVRLVHRVRSSKTSGPSEGGHV